MSFALAHRMQGFALVDVFGEDTPRKQIDHSLTMAVVVHEHSKRKRVIPKDVNQVLYDVLCPLSLVLVLFERVPRTVSLTP